jgi:hypothetical protein
MPQLGNFVPDTFPLLSRAYVDGAGIHLDAQPYEPAPWVRWQIEPYEAGDVLTIAGECHDLNLRFYFRANYGPVAWIQAEGPFSVTIAAGGAGNTIDIVGTSSARALIPTLTVDKADPPA